jgi:hypothetical protein
MIIIRNDTMQAFGRAANYGFEVRMLDRLRTHFPKHKRYLGEPQQRELVRLAVERAQSHVLTAERSMAMYLDLMCVLGSEFDTDPQLPWAADILADRSFAAQSDRIDLLHSRGWEFANKVSADFHNTLGQPAGSPLIAALSEIRRQSVDELTPDAARGVSREICGKLRDLFPIKSETIGDESVCLLVRDAMKSATSYGIRSARGMWLFAALMSVVGAGFHRDPQLPWASRTLSDAALDATQRVNRLFAEAVTNLKRWWGDEAGAML